MDLSSSFVVALLQATDVTSSINSWMMSSSSPGDVLLQQLHLHADQQPISQAAGMNTESAGASSQAVNKHHQTIVCPVCCKVFDGRNKKQNLKHHLMTHTGERRFTCPYCGHRTAHKWHLKTHVLRRHPDNIMDEAAAWLGFRAQQNNISEIDLSVLEPSMANIVPAQHDSSRGAFVQTKAEHYSEPSHSL